MTQCWNMNNELDGKEEAQSKKKEGDKLKDWDHIG